MSCISIALVLALACSLKFAAAQGVISCYDATNNTVPVQSVTNPNAYAITGSLVSNQSSCLSIPVSGTSYLASKDVTFSGEPAPLRCLNAVEVDTAP